MRVPGKRTRTSQHITTTIIRDIVSYCAISHQIVPHRTTRYHTCGNIPSHPVSLPPFHDAVLAVLSAPAHSATSALAPGFPYTPPCTHCAPRHRPAIPPGYLWQVADREVGSLRGDHRHGSRRFRRRSRQVRGEGCTAQRGTFIFAPCFALIVVLSSVEGDCRCCRCWCCSRLCCRYGSSFPCVVAVGEVDKCCFSRNRLLLTLLADGVLHGVVVEWSRGRRASCLLLQS